MRLMVQLQQPLLDYLRNLTPQVLLATTALLLYAELDFSHMDRSAWLRAIALGVTALLTVVAYVANINLFVDKLLDAAFALMEADGGPPADAPVGTRARKLWVLWKVAPVLSVVMMIGLALVGTSTLAIVYAVGVAAKNALR